MKAKDFYNVAVYLRLSKDDGEAGKVESNSITSQRDIIRSFIRKQDNIVIAKLKSNKPLTSSDVKVLEDILWGKIGTKQEYEAEYGEKPLGEFVREIVGLDMNAAKEAFSEYLDETNLDSRQIYFVNQIVEYIVHNGMMKDLSVLQETPFTDKGSIVEIFTDLSVWMGIRKAMSRLMRMRSQHNIEWCPLLWARGTIYRINIPRIPISIGEQI